MKPIATDMYDFEGLITQGYSYVDKTAVLYPFSNKSITLISISFSSEKRTIVEEFV